MVLVITPFISKITALTLLGTCRIEIFFQKAYFRHLGFDFFGRATPGGFIRINSSKVVFLPPRLTISSKATLEFSGFKFTPAMASVKIRTFRPSLSASNAEYLTQ